jgi:hypothetical protein
MNGPTSVPFVNEVDVEALTSAPRPGRMSLSPLDTED